MTYYRWEPHRSVWSNLVRRVLVREGGDGACLAVVDRTRRGDWTVVKPGGLGAVPHPDAESAERAAEGALGIVPSEVSR